MCVFFGWGGEGGKAGSVGKTKVKTKKNEGFEDKGEGRARDACILQSGLNKLSASRSVGGLARLRHLPKVSENDKARKVRKKGRTT